MLQWPRSWPPREQQWQEKYSLLTERNLLAHMAIILRGDKWNILEILSLCKTTSSQWFSAVAINRLPFQCTYSLTPSIKRSTHCSPTQLVKLVNYVCICVQRNVASDMRHGYLRCPTRNLPVWFCVLFRVKLSYWSKVKRRPPQNQPPFQVPTDNQGGSWHILFGFFLFLKKKKKTG